MFKFFPQRQLNGTSSINKTKEALRIVNHIQLLNYNISPEFASIDGLCFVIEQFDGDQHAVQFQKAGRHLTGLFLSDNNMRELGESINHGVYGLVRFLKSQNYETCLIQEAFTPDHYYRGMLLFDFIRELSIIEEMLCSDSSSEEPSKAEDPKQRLNQCLDCLTSWTQFISREWESETGKPIIGDELLALTIKILLILPKKYIVKTYSILEKMTNCEITGVQSFALVNLSSALFIIIENKQSCSEDEIDLTATIVSQKIIIPSINFLVLTCSLRYRMLIMESVNVLLYENQIKSRKFIFNGYAFIEDEVHFFDEILRIIQSKNTSSDEYQAILIVINKLNSIGNIVRQFTLMHSSHIELSLILMEELKFFMEKEFAYPSNPQWDIYKNSERKFIEMYKEIIKMVADIEEMQCTQNRLFSI